MPIAFKFESEYLLRSVFRLLTVSDHARSAGAALPRTPKMNTKTIAPSCIVPSGLYCLPRKQLKHYRVLRRRPRVGDVVYGTITRIGFHSTLENKNGRIHAINKGTQSLFVLGSRYAPDAYEGLVPSSVSGEVDLLARSGLVGKLVNKNAGIADPTRVKIHGYACTADGKVLNTLDYPIIKEPKPLADGRPRAKMILVIGTAMNSGKSRTAAAICWALAAKGYTVRGSKVTGTASLKDILHMEDAGASRISDFTYFGYPSTYMLDEQEVVGIFDRLDRRYANDPKNYWVVEIADGILQRETAMLLASPRVKSRIHRLAFAACDAMGILGGLAVLKDKYGLRPDLISGKCSSSPLIVGEVQDHTDIPIVSNMQPDLAELRKLVQ